MTEVKLWTVDIKKSLHELRKEKMNEKEILKILCTRTSFIQDTTGVVEKQKQILLTDYTWIELDFKFIGEAKKHNIYYKASHNASRRAIAKK